ncbi:4-oxalocrotonate tautomerase [Zoogloea oleivorans]|uniref:4-oxalocrotonate tautomerase n=1 Tax=Zoogloea oleivorans TaxID=1552750 RepID=A0A6C2CDT3_9RHOO|nr:tautomerase family protein [Zoogloea oleivorans]TYC51415.1 4-oxalocrotonate tautomerase [Zoogloea oleivorans]
MPILNIHLVRGQHAADRVENLLLRCSEAFAAGLRCPLDRVRVFVTEHEPHLMCVGGQLVRDAGVNAPYFSFIVLEGRSLEDRQQLLAAFTDLIVELLDVPRELVRGGIVPVAPADWSIGGQPASSLRQAEIEARRLAAGNS